MTEDKIRDVIIIGGGPAGVSAAIYAARGELDTLVIDSSIIGGQLNTYQDIDNYPGFLSNKAFELVQQFEGQLKSNNVDIATFKEITNVQLEGPTKVIKTTDGKYKAKTVIICTGANPRKIGVKGEDDYRGRGVSYCAVCDGAFFREKEIIVVGGGNSAIEEGIYLTKFASKVTIVHRRNCLRATKNLQEKALHHPKINILWDTVVEEIQGDENKVTNVILKNVETEKTFNMKIDGVFPFVGLTSNTQLFEGNLELDSGKNIVCDQFMRTNIPGVFAAGDVRATPIRQVVIAASDGAIAATSAIRYIDEGEFVIRTEAEETALADKC